MNVRLVAERRYGELLKELARMPLADRGAIGAATQGKEAPAPVAGASPYREAIERDQISERKAQRLQALAEVMPASGRAAGGPWAPRAPSEGGDEGGGLRRAAAEGLGRRSEPEGSRPNTRPSSRLHLEKRLLEVEQSMLSLAARHGAAHPGQGHPQVRRAAAVGAFGEGWRPCQRPTGRGRPIGLAFDGCR